MKSGRLGLYRDRVTNKSKNKTKPKEKDSDIVGKTAKLKEVTRGERNKAISDFKKMKEKNLANFTRSSSKAGMSGKTGGSKSKSTTKSSGKTSTAKAGSNISKSDGKKYNVGVSKGGVSFGEAFKHFRNKGVKEFTWNGKRYTTKTKED